MVQFKSTLNSVMLFSALLGLVFVIGCGGSAEKQEMSDFLKLYSDAVNEYVTADDTQRTQLKEKLESYRVKWMNLKAELNDQVTPGVLEELDREYKEISKKYASLNS